jgi:hypothetical protein
MKTVIAMVLMVLAVSAHSKEYNWREDPKISPVCVTYADMVGDLIRIRNKGGSLQDAKSYAEDRYHLVPRLGNLVDNEIFDVFILNSRHRYDPIDANLRFNAIGCEIFLDNLN